MIGLDVYLYSDGLRVASPEDIEKWESEREMYEPNVRLFVALFSYNPAVMSPNPETMEEELPFQQGQIIKVKMIFFFFSVVLFTIHNQSQCIIFRSFVFCFAHALGSLRVSGICSLVGIWR